MGSSSGSAHRGLVHWQGLLLVVSLLNFWSRPTTAYMEVEETDALEHADVVLHIRNRPPNTAAFLWYKGEEIDSDHNIAYLYINSGSYVRCPPGGQAMVEDDGSLLLKNISMTDAGVYTVLAHLKGCQKMIVCGRLNVYQSVIAPTLAASNTFVTKKKDAVVMSCYTNDAVEWLFQGRKLTLTERMKLSPDSRTLTIDPVLMSDAGDYQCKAYNRLSWGKSPQLHLYVEY